MAIQQPPSSPALPSASPAQAPSSPTPGGNQDQPQLKAVLIVDNGDGSYTVQSSDELQGTESPSEQGQEPEESKAPVKSIDEALAKAKTILTGEVSDSPGAEQQSYDSAFPTDK